MKITGFENQKTILVELGDRMKQYRISLNITQNELAKKCGISTSTVVRMENGDDPKLSNVIKILSVFGLLENLNILIPEQQPDYKAMFEEKTVRKRARPVEKKPNTAWVWGEDEEANTP
ncbi:MAG: helix-turn-helix transcriptional regulator [Clostridia bacterium]|nr:helix-turn-helix transcriptional regulator [Clostridia bacterium]